MNIEQWTTTEWIIAIVVVAVLMALLTWAFMQRQRSSRLRERFGDEYDHLVDTTGGRREAELELEARQERVEALDIRSLSAEERHRFTEEWRSAQAHFVDEPARTIEEADRLVQDLMRARGYPVGDFEQRAADISVYYPDVVTNYRAARDIAHANRRGEASTEDLRQAMVHYRSLFEELLESREPIRSNGNERRT